MVQGVENIQILAKNKKHHIDVVVDRLRVKKDKLFEIRLTDSLEAAHLGGQIVDQGTPDQIKENPVSITGKFLTGKEQIKIPVKEKP